MNDPIDPVEWRSAAEPIAGDSGIRVTLLREREPLSYEEVIRRWQDDPVFRRFFIGLLAHAPYRAYFWETPSVSKRNRGRRFEFALIDSPQLADASPDATAFREHFSDCDARMVVEFSNLAGDAWLVVPCPLGASAGYPHLAMFSRHAALAQQHALWQRVGVALEARLGDRPIWLSTAGTGIAWLHVRLDARPKYYVHQAYARVEAEQPRRAE